MTTFTYAEEIFNKCLDILKDREKYKGVMEKTAVLFNDLTGNNMKTEDAYLFLVVMKLQRLMKDGEEDSLVDLINYLILYMNEIH